MEQRKSPTVAGLHEDELDRISELPDEILHDILSRIKSQKFIGKATILSKRWANLWFSYPTLEFNGNDFKSKETLKSFAAAAAKKFSSFQHQNNTDPDLSSVTIKFDISGWMGNYYPDFCTTILNDLLGFVAENPPQEIYVTASNYSIPREFLLPSGGRLCRIKNLCLQNCNFDRYANLFTDDNNSNPFDCLRGSLKTLSLMSVKFPDGGRILNSMIAGASLLEELTVMFFRGVQRVQVRNLPNLKILKLYARDKVDFDIAWRHCPSKDGPMEIVLTPDLTSVEIASSRACLSTKCDVERLISECPVLVSPITSTSDPASPVHDLKIVNNDMLKEVKLSSWNYPIALPRTTFLPWVKIWFFPTILSKDHKSFALVTIHIPLSRHHLHDLGKLLGKLNRFWLTIELINEFPNDRAEDVDQFKYVQSPFIEHVIVSEKFLTSCNKKEFFLDIIFYCCRPKFLSVTPRIYKGSREKMLSAAEYMQQVFMKNEINDCCRIKCNCWRQQLKDVEILQRSIKGSIKEDKIMNISKFMFSSLGEQDQIWFILIWR
ncbi:unnamed protein product [Linum trigynum]|uniref:F-box domain-containing protein n=1 Tax=Linum trigynum TaxID=586398 RepID=A0AAV2F5N1_9ROSI